MGEKIAYGTGSIIDMWGNWLYVGMVWPVFNIFLHVSPTLVSLALMLNRLFDAISDPFFGWWSDNTRSRWGRRRPFILVGGIMAGVCLPLLFAVPQGWSEMQYFWWMVGSSAVYITIVSCVMVPFNSLGYEMTPDYHERTSVFAFKGAIQKLPEIAMFMAAAFCTATVWAGATGADAFDRLSLMASRSITWFHAFFSGVLTLQWSRVVELIKTPFGWESAAEGGEVSNVLLGAQVYTTILGAIMVIVGFVLFFTLKERYYTKVVTKGSEQKKVKIAETFGQTLTCRPFRAQLAMVFSYGMGTSMVGTLGYYCTVYYVCRGDVALGSIWNFGMGLMGMVFGLLGVPVFSYLARRFGKREAMKVVQLSAMVVFAATWVLYDPEIQWLQMFATGLIAFTGVGFWMLDGSIMADVVDADELESGKRREGAFSATRSWIMKVGMAAGIFFSGVILQSTGFDAALGANQTDHAIFNIRFYLAVIPIVGLIVAFFALLRFGLTPERMAEIRAQLEARRGTI
jgi:glycoside/pentoside/hexuronide:cation symporter, GPH family